jgi:hypothetical protein
MPRIDRGRDRTTGPAEAQLFRADFLNFFARAPLYRNGWREVDSAPGETGGRPGVLHSKFRDSGL